MPKNISFNWPVVIMLLLAGALPALPGIYIVAVILQGAPADGSQHSFVRAHYFASPAPILIHAIAGIIFAAVMPFQFSPSLRQRRPNWHRRGGRATILSACVMALSAFWMIAVFPASGGVLKTAGFLTTGVGMLLTFSISLHAIRARKIARHRLWMMRAVAVSYGAVLPALILIPVYFAFGEPPQITDELARWFGMTLNLLIVEIIRRKSARRNRAYTKAAL